MKRNRREKGQGLVEYALIIVLVAIVVIVALQLMGPVVGNVFSDISQKLQGPGPIGGVVATPGGGSVIVEISVSETAYLYISGDVSGEGSCSPPSCTFNLSGPSTGSATITAEGGGAYSFTW